jgi:hypothetical protein
MPLAMVPPIGKYVPPAPPVPILKKVGDCAIALEAISRVAATEPVSTCLSDIGFSDSFSSVRIIPGINIK